MLKFTAGLSLGLNLTLFLVSYGAYRVSMKDREVIAMLQDRLDSNRVGPNPFV